MTISTENEVKSNGKTTILLCGETRDQLRSLGKKGESYDAIIRALLKKWNGEI